MIIRDVRMWELRKIEELEREIFELDAYPYEYLYYLFWNSDYFKVAVDNDEIIGYIIGEIVGDSSHIITIAVVEGYRRRGIGSNLLNSFIEYSTIATFVILKSSLLGKGIFNFVLSLLKL